MGKRSNFERRECDAYATPAAAVAPLIPHLRGIRTFAEPCCGDGALVRHLEAHGLRCVYTGDISTGQDALARSSYGDPDAIITNPPDKRPLLHPLIQRFQRIAPTWLLIDQDWSATKQAVPYLGACTDIQTACASSPRRKTSSRETALQVARCQSAKSFELRAAMSLARAAASARPVSSGVWVVQRGV
jgi:hypothetical protein